MRRPSRRIYSRRPPWRGPPAAAITRTGAPSGPSGARGEGGQRFGDVVDAEGVDLGGQQLWGELEGRAPGEELPSAAVDQVDDGLEGALQRLRLDLGGTQRAPVRGEYLDVHGPSRRDCPAERGA